MEQTTYYNCAYWQSPNVAKSLTKGTLVELSGRTSSNAWIGKDGEIRSGLNFHTSNIKFQWRRKREGVQNFVTEKAQDKNICRRYRRRFTILITQNYGSTI